MNIAVGHRLQLDMQASHDYKGAVYHASYMALPLKKALRDLSASIAMHSQQLMS